MSVGGTCRYHRLGSPASRFVILAVFAIGFTLMGCGRASRVGRLIADLQSVNPEVRQKAAGVLRELRDPSALDALIVALGDEDAGVRFQAAAALGELGDPRAIRPLVATLKDPDNDVRWAASFALRDLGARAVDSLVIALEDSDSKVRAGAARALGEIRDPRAVDPLIARLEDSQPVVQSIAASALVRIGAPAAERLIPALRGGDLAAVARAYLFFVAWAEPGSEDVLIQTLNTKGTPEMAQVFLNCGNLKLKDAAERWAGSHGYSTVSLPRSGGGALSWGSRR